jgi:hypothetical protein
MITNNLELLGFTIILSGYASQQTNEIELTQSEMLELTGFSKGRFIHYIKQLKELKIFIVKYDHEDNRVNRYFIHPYIYFQGQVNISLLSYLLEITKELDDPCTYLIIKDNEVKANMINDMLKTQERYVYFIENELNKEIKIGVTSNIENRLKQISIMVNAPVTLLKYIDGNEQTEKELHNKFSKYRLHGEWFKPDKELILYILQL